MKEFFVQSGPLKITVVAEDAHDAAIEALQWWGVSADDNLPQNHRFNLEEQIFVRPMQVLSHGRRFATFPMLARARGEAAANAWEKLLRTEIAAVN